jgi:Barstar (barnase inhibitor)
MRCNDVNVQSTEAPFFHLFVGDIGDLGKYHASLRSKEKLGVVVRLLRGENMNKWLFLFNEMAAALQLPLYFGKNINALDECLADLNDWLPAEAYVLVISQTMLVLSEEREDDFVAFFRLLVDISKDSAGGTLPGANWKRKPTPFHVVLNAKAEEAGSLVRILEPTVGHIPSISIEEDRPSTGA